MDRIEDVPEQPGAESADTPVPDPGDERLLALLDALPTAASIATAADQIVVHSNAAWLRLLGFSSMDGVRGRTIESFMFPASLEKARKALAHAKDTGEYSRTDRRYQLVRADGVVIDVEVAGAPAILGGQPAIVSIVTDITADETMQREMAEVTAFSESIVESIPIGMHFYRLEDDGRLIFTGANPAADTILGIDHSTLVGMAILEAFPSLAGNQVPEVYARLAREGGSWHEENVLYEDTRIASSFDVHAFQTGVGTMVAAFTDTTERKRAEAALALETQRLHAHIDNSPLATVEFDSSSRVTRWSDSATRMFGWAAEEVLGKRVIGDFRWVHEDDIAAVERLAADMARGGSPSTVGENRNYRKDGSIIDCIWYNSVLLDGSGEVDSLMSRVLDVTVAKQAERALRTYREDLERIVEERTSELTESNQALEEASHAKSQFLASMSHELRTPLNSIIGFTGIMLQGLTGELTSEQRAQLEMVNRAGRQLLGLVSDVLDLERVEAGRVQLDLEDVDVRRFATTLTDTVRPMAEDVGLTVDLDLESAPVTVHTDRAKLEQILLNFLSNSIKYTEVGGINLRVAACSDGSVAFAVRDTGIGIAAEDQASIFEEFRQLPSHRSAKHPGSGLGLAISTQLAAVIGGRIELESALGEGATFTLVLPPG